MKINDLTTIRVFKSIYETRSLTDSSRLMGLSKPALSKRLDALEVELGFKLFSRTTRSVIPTQQANVLIAQVNEIILRVDELNTHLKKTDVQKKKVRMTCIASMSQRFVGKILRVYQRKNPDIEIELIVTDSVLDPIEHNLDLVIRVNPAKNSNLVGRKIGDYKLVVVASPQYLKKSAKIKKLEDLKHHDLLLIDQHLTALNFIPPQRSFTTNDSPLVSQLILEGHSVGIRSSWDTTEMIRKKKLAMVLPGATIRPQGEIWLLSGKEKFQGEAVRELFDHLIKEFALYF